ncbi:uncharacterized protein PV09_05566 [Verruconis gallopava]|uniref:Pru domain-containing protein n=1 Tax=Verruconis gallopava TaxID=253628 RepID=A0A0D2A9C2_9PEZI|nr:uncharacterized protein PV09_05566 [Verruconis gallopava]KIW03358.1 hypothetical protein PV09_05566 [Verruconis gallopava]
MAFQPFQPLITFKAGMCKESTSGGKTIECLPTPGFIYLYQNAEDELTHFCWSRRSDATNEPELDLLMFPGDGSFTPYTDPKSTGKDKFSPTNGRIFRLKFSSSQDRHFFWLQSKPTHPSGKPNYFSERDLKLGAIVNDILQGEEVDVQAALSSAGPGRPDEDEDMGDAPPDDELRRTGTGGAGPGATGGDFREEGEEAREGGADGARAASSGLTTDANDAVQNFLRSLSGGNASGGFQNLEQNSAFASLTDLLTPEACIATLSNASPSYLDNLLSNLPPQLLVLAQRADDTASLDSSAESTTDAQATIDALSISQKKEILTRVFRSPQLFQSLGSLTAALRDGGLPMVAEALQIKVANGGLIKGGHMPLGGGQAVQAFLDGVRKSVEEEDKDESERNSVPSGRMDIS